MNLNFLKNKEINNAGWLIAGKIAQMILSLFVGIISARYLGPANYGLVSYGMAFVSLFMSFCTLGINSVIVKDFFDNPDEQGLSIGTTIVLRMFSSLFSCILIIGISFVLEYGQWETITVVALCSISLLFHAFDTINKWFQAQYKSKITAIVTLAAYVCTSLYKIVLLALNKSVIWFAFASSVDYIAMGILLVLFYKKHSGPKMCFSWSKGKTLLNQSYHYIFSGMMVAIYSQTDKLMLKHMLDETSVGYYAVGGTVASMWTFILQSIIDAMYPTIINSYSEGSEKAPYAELFYSNI